MVEQPENNIIHFDMTKLSSEDAVTLVEQCEKIPVRYLWEKLSSYIRQLKIAANYNSIDTLDSFIHIVNKGFRYKSEEANALRYFYWGYFSHMQEQLLQMFDEEARRKTISVISSTKHFAPIMQYLYLNGCSRQRDIALRLEIDKSNLSRVLKALVNCGLLNKMTGPKHVFYELSPDGYAYCKHHDISHLYSISATSKYARLQSDAAQMRAELTHTKDNDFFLVPHQRIYPKLICGWTKNLLQILNAV